MTGEARKIVAGHVEVAAEKGRSPIIFIKGSENGSGTTKSAERKVLVRYFLDRTGYSIADSSARVWNNPPQQCSAAELANFFHEQGIKLIDDSSLLIEVYLEKYQSYMLLEVFEQEQIMFDFSHATASDPVVLNCRLTDLSSGREGGGALAGLDEHGGHIHFPQNATANPVGLYAFSMTVILEAADLFGKLVKNTTDPSFVLTWGPYAFWVSGLLQLIAGLIETSRNNVYGGTAFLAFGSFWLANGTKLILQAYFPDQIPDEYLGADPVGNFIRNIHIFGLACALFKQTLTMNKFSSVLILMLMLQMFATSLTGWSGDHKWSEAFEWIQLIMMVFVASWAFCVFVAEFTNEVYNRQVFNLHPWTTEADKGVFSAAGRTSTLQLPARLRSAQHHSMVHGGDGGHTHRTKQPSNFHKLRSAAADTTDVKKEE